MTAWPRIGAGSWEIGPPTLTGEASDVEVVIVDAHHFPFAGVSTSVALDDVGAASGIVRTLLIRNCRKKQGDQHVKGPHSFKKPAIRHSYDLNWN